MWESLGSSYREDRALHGAAKALNVAVGSVALPVWLVGQRLREPLRAALGRLDPSPAALPVAQPRERTMAALMDDLESIPSGLHHSEIALLRKGVPDMSTFVLAQQREAANLGYAYPAQFSDHVFEGADGERIAASIGLHAGVRRPGLIVVHGLFSSRRFDYVREIAVRAFFEWGFNVAAIDLRSFGLTNLTSPAPTSTGWKEGEDILAGGGTLRRSARPRSALWEFRLGARPCSAPATSRAPTRASTAASSRSLLRATRGRWPSGCPRRCRPRIRRTPQSRVLGDAHVAHPPGELGGRRGLRRPDRADLRALLRGRARGALAPRRCSRAHRRRKVPVLVLHPKDDEIVPVGQAEELAVAASGNDLVRVWFLEGGGHGAIDAVDRTWFYAVTRGFFERWAGYEAGAGAREGDGGSERAEKSIYSAAR